MTDAAPAKICVFCGQDCAGKPRAKDKQGRYVCKPCLKKRQLEKDAEPAQSEGAYDVAPAPSAEPKSGDPLLAAMLDERVSQAGHAACPECGTLMRPGAVMCVTCGYNAERGKSLKTRVMTEKAKKERPTVSITGGHIALGLLGLWVIMGGIAFAVGSLPAVLALYVLAAASSVAGTIMIIVHAFRSGETGWGLVGILQFVIPGVSLAFIYYAIVCDTGVGKALYWMGALGGAIAVIVGFAVLPDFLAEIENMAAMTVSARPVPVG